MLTTNVRNPKENAAQGGAKVPVALGDATWAWKRGDPSDPQTDAFLVARSNVDKHTDGVALAAIPSPLYQGIGGLQQF